MLAEAAHSLRLVFFDPRCRRCGNSLVFHDEIIVCRNCVGEVLPVSGPVCLRCGKMLNDSARLCGDCMLRPPVFVRNVSFGLYKGALREFILLYKYAELHPLRRRLGGYLLELFETQLDERFDFIMTVPQDPARHREFDHLLEMAKIVAKKSGIPLLKKNLVKRRKTEPQSRLPLKQRLRNLDGAFELKRPRQVSAKRILLIDDVFTTGTTITRCAELLIRQGAEVTTLTLARSV